VRLRASRNRHWAANESAGLFTSLHGPWLLPAVVAASSLPMPRFHCFQITDRSLRRSQRSSSSSTEGVWLWPKYPTQPRRCGPALGHSLHLTPSRPPRQFPHLLLESEHRLRRDSPFPIRREAESEKLPFPGPGHRTRLLVHLELELRRNESREAHQRKPRFPLGTEAYSCNDSARLLQLERQPSIELYDAGAARAQ
jgi:hypothetical protein